MFNSTVYQTRNNHFLSLNENTRKWLTLTIVLFATFMSLIDAFIVYVTVPSIKVNLHATDSQVEWVITAYLLAYAVLLVTGGRLGDIYGRKRVFILGMIGFIITSFSCGISFQPDWLIISRVLQGASAACMIPQVLSTIQVNFEGPKRALVLGIYGAVIGLGSILGQVFGGLLLEWNLFGLGWRNAFFINIPFGLLALLGSVYIIVETKSETAKRLDWAGVFLVTIAMLFLVYPLVSGRELGWPIWTFICMIIFAVLMVFFLVFEKKIMNNGGSPLIVLSLFKEKVFNVGMIVAILFYTGNAGLFFMIPLYCQYGLGYNALQSALIFVPLGLGFLVSSMSASRLVNRFSIRVINIGTGLMFLSYLILSFLIGHFGQQISNTFLAILFFLSGLGQGIVASPLINAVLSKIKSKDVGSASGILTTTTQFAQVLGIAIFGVVFFGLRDLHMGNYSIAFQQSLWLSILLSILTFIGILFFPVSKTR